VGKKSAPVAPLYFICRQCSPNSTAQGAGILAGEKSVMKRITERILRKRNFS
jgi:hypothetical protein